MTTKIYITATAVDPDTGDTSTGWIDPTWSMHQLHDNKEDVAPVEFDPEFDDSLDALIEETIGSIDSVEDTTYYGADSPQETSTGLYWSYCAHVEEN